MLLEVSLPKMEAPGSTDGLPTTADPPNFCHVQSVIDVIVGMLTDRWHVGNPSQQGLSVPAFFTAFWSLGWVLGLGSHRTVEKSCLGHDELD